jgi:hypothetical protein
VLTLTELSSWWKALHVQSRGCCYWWEDDPIIQLVLYKKKLSLDGCLGVEPRRVGIALADGFCELGKTMLAEGLHDWGRRAVPLLNFSLVFV